MSHDIAYHSQKVVTVSYKFRKKRGIHISNATHGGVLEGFDRVDYSSLFIRDGGQV